MSVIDIFRHNENLDIESTVVVYSGPDDNRKIFQGEMHSFIAHYPLIARENEVTSFFIFMDTDKWAASFHV